MRRNKHVAGSSCRGRIYGKSRPTRYEYSISPALHPQTCRRPRQIIGYGNMVITRRFAGWRELCLCAHTLSV